MGETRGAVNLVHPHAMAMPLHLQLAAMLREKSSRIHTMSSGRQRSILEEEERSMQSSSTTVPVRGGGEGS